MRRFYPLHALGRPADAGVTERKIPVSTLWQSQQGTEYDQLEICLNMYPAEFDKAKLKLRYAVRTKEADETYEVGWIVTVQLYLHHLR